MAGTRKRDLSRGTYTNYEDDLLPKGVRFSVGQTNVDSRAAALLTDGDSSEEIAMVLFYPDGTSQDAKLLFENDDQLYVQLELRGLTGTARTVRIENPNPENQ